MKGNPEERAIALGEYVTQTGATVRSAAKKFGISKSTYESVQRVLQLNKEERHLRGGAATRQKYHPNTHGSF